jgi:hypothetical protein
MDIANIVAIMGEMATARKSRRWRDDALPKPAGIVWSAAPASCFLQRLFVPWALQAVNCITEKSRRRRNGAPAAYPP